LVKSTSEILGVTLKNISFQDARLDNRTQEVEKRIQQKILAQNQTISLLQLKADVSDLISFIILTLQQI